MLHLVQTNDLAPLAEHEPTADETTDLRVSEYADLHAQIAKVDELVTQMLLSEGLRRPLSTLDLLEVKGELITLRARASAFACRL